MITTIANSRVTHALATGVPVHRALTEGFQRGILVAAVLAAINLLVAAISPRLEPDAELVMAASAAA